MARITANFMLDVQVSVTLKFNSQVGDFLFQFKAGDICLDCAYHFLLFFKIVYFIDKHVVLCAELQWKKGGMLQTPGLFLSFYRMCECPNYYKEYVTLQTARQHDLESHFHDKSTKGLSIAQGAVLEQVVRAYPLASATDARRSPKFP